MFVLLWFSLVIGSAAVAQHRHKRLLAVDGISLKGAVQNKSKKSKYVKPCDFEFQFHAKDEPSGGVFAGEKLIVPDDSGKLLICDMKTKDVIRSFEFKEQYDKFDGYADLESVTIVDPESTILYFALENKPRIVEYDFGQEKLLRVFDLPNEVKNDLDTANNRGIESLTFINALAIPAGGYFYIGSQNSGKVHIVEVPLDTGKSKDGNLIATKFIDTWKPVDDRDLAGLDYDHNGHIFLNFDDGDYNTVLVYDIDETTGLPKKDVVPEVFKGHDLKCDEHPQIKVPCFHGGVTDSEGIAVRQVSSNKWEIAFSSDTEVKVFGYIFDINGLHQHPLCAAGKSKTSSASYHRTDYLMMLIFLLII